MTAVFQYDNDRYFTKPTNLTFVFQIPAVYDFGLFMSLIVSTCWISVFVLMPPALYLYACFFEPIETYLLS